MREYFTLEVNSILDKTEDSCYHLFTSEVNFKKDDELKVKYRNKKIEKICTDAKTAERTYGQEMAEKIQLRIDQISAADTVEMMIKYHIGRCHPLKQKRKGQYAVDLVNPYRLVFEKEGDVLIQIALICKIIDYH